MLSIKKFLYRKFDPQSIARPTKINIQSLGKRTDWTVVLGYGFLKAEKSVFN